MNTKFQRSWQLFKASLSVTLRNRRLLWFPLLSALLTAVMAIFFLSPVVLPIVLHPTGYHLSQKQHWMALMDYYLPDHANQSRPAPGATPPDALRVLTGQPAAAQTSGQPAAAQTSGQPAAAQTSGQPAAAQTSGQPAAAQTSGQPAAAQTSGQPARGRASPLLSAYLVLLYFGSMFLATFFNVAFYNEIIAALNGQEVSLQRGLRLACSRWPSIFAWALLAGAVGWTIRKVEERLPLFGRIVTGLLGLAWSVAAVFVIPVIVREQPRHNPIKILQQSALTLKRTWGEGLIGYVGFSAGTAALFACWLIPLLLLGGLAFLLESGWGMVIAGSIWFLGLLLLGYVSAVARHVYRCALYLYAAEGVVPEPYNQELLDMAWKVKKNSP